MIHLSSVGGTRHLVIRTKLLAVKYDKGKMGVLRNEIESMKMMMYPNIAVVQEQMQACMYT